MNDISDVALERQVDTMVKAIRRAIVKAYLEEEDLDFGPIMAEVDRMAKNVGREEALDRLTCAWQCEPDILWDLVRDFGEALEQTGVFKGVTIDASPEALGLKIRDRMTYIVSSAK